MKTCRGTWYEVWIKKSYGGRLSDTYNNLRDAKAAIKNAIEKEKAGGYKPSEYFIMIADSIHTLDDDGETVFRTTTYARA